MTQRPKNKKGRPRTATHERQAHSSRAPRSRVAYMEGKNAVVEALRAETPLQRIFLAEGMGDETYISEIVKRAERAGIEIVTMRRGDMDQVSEHGAHQGVMAELAPYQYTPLRTILAQAEGKESGLIIALDHITDPGNLGAIARSAEVVGATGIIVPSKRSAAITPAAYKASAGALSHIPVAQETNLVRALKACKDAGFWIAGASEEADTLLWDAPLEGRIVLVMGSEGEGLARLTQETCDFLVALPQAGKIASLNVAQATTAIAYEWLRRTRLADAQGAVGATSSSSSASGDAER